MCFELCVQVVQHHAGLDLYRALVHVKLDDVANVFAVVNHQARARGLTALAGAAATRHDGHAQVAANGHGGGHFVVMARHKNTHRRDLVNRRIRGIAATVGGREQHLTFCLGTQPSRQATRHFVGGTGHALVELAGGFGDLAGQGGVHVQALRVVFKEAKLGLALWLGLACNWASTTSRLCSR